MHPVQHLSWRKWPFVASVVAILFIAYGITLVSRSRELQERIAHEVDLLEELNGITDAVTQLGIVHRVDVNARQYQWPGEMERLQQRIASTQARFPDSPGMDALPQDLERILHQVDSLHREAMSVGTARADLHNIDAVLQIMLQRAMKTVDRTARKVHEEGLAAHTTTLSHGWDEAQMLLVAACLLAVALAWLVAVSNRLLRESRHRSAQLDHARRDLERTNRELRETMLSKEEKEVMIKEIHHRVKNNLQIVKSLIRFQMDQVKDKRTLELFNECVNRVSAMALVHEQTYLSKDLANIEVDSYLNALIRDLVHAYAVGIRLNMDVDIRVKTLGVDTLVPLGLLINEVISNSFKHAFKGRSVGTIIVHIDGSEQEGLQVRIGDDGVGLPDRKQWENPQSLGMDLIHTLAGQLDVRVDLADGPGTVYQLSPIRAQARKRA